VSPTPTLSGQSHSLDNNLALLLRMLAPTAVVYRNQHHLHEVLYFLILS
jgi:hypothetical protein